MHAKPIRFISLVAAGYFVCALAIYWPSLPGPFYSDDVQYIVQNEYIHSLTREHLRAILDPWGAPGKMTWNYAPVHLLLHGFEFQVFQGWMPGYHIVNVLLHSLAGALLVLLLIGSRLPAGAAVAAGAFFVVHPANVEAVAWISQLKSTAGLALALLALVLYRRHPGWSVPAFALAILTKALAAFALPVALLFEWTAGRDPRETSNESERAKQRTRRLLSLVLWALVFVVFAAVEFPVFRYTNANIPPIAEDSIGTLRAMIAIAGSYLVMAATSWGVGAFQEAPEAGSWMEPWVFLSIPLLALLAARLISTTRRRSVEAVYWWWAVFSFAPICQIFPFLHPLADRYLYFILPGLIGGTALAARSSWLGSWLQNDASRVLRSSLIVGFALWLVLFGLRSHERAKLWAEPTSLDREAVRNHPDGLSAQLEGAREAAQRGDVEAVVAHLRFARDRGRIDFTSYPRDPVWDPVRDDPRFQAAVQEMARKWLVLEPLFQRPSQVELRGLARAHWVVGELVEAEALLERALEVGGLRDPQVRRELVAVRVAIQRERRAIAEPDERQPERGD